MPLYQAYEKKLWGFSLSIISGKMKRMEKRIDPANVGEAGGAPEVPVKSVCLSEFLPLI